MCRFGLGDLHAQQGLGLRANKDICGFTTVRLAVYSC